MRQITLIVVLALVACGPTIAPKGARPAELPLDCHKLDDATLGCNATLTKNDWREPAILVRAARHKLAIEADGRRIHTFGDFNNEREADYLGEPFHLVGLGAQEIQPKTLAFTVVSRIGEPRIEGAVVIGEREDLRRDLVLGGASHFIVGSALFILGAVLLLVRARGADPMLGSFAVFSLGLGVYSVCHSGLLIFFAPYPLGWDRLQYAVTYATPFAFIDFVGRLVGGLRFPFLSRGRYVFLVLSVATTIGALAGLFELPQTLGIFQLAVFIFGLATLLEIGLRAAGGDRTARALGFGLGLVCVTAVHDVLVDREMLPWSFGLLSWASLALIIQLASSVVSRMRKEAERKTALQKDLETAGILQTRLLPSKQIENKSFSLHTYNRSADQIGGDWFAYRLFDDRWLQLHLGDVTGHGTQAALLASFAKGAVDFFWEDCIARGKTKPPLDELHSQLNKALCVMGHGEATMTLISMTVDLVTGETEIVNSGHPAPAIFAGGAVKPFMPGVRNSTILGTDPDFASRGPHPIKLFGDELILLPSDGLLEMLAPEGGPARRIFGEFLKLTVAEDARYAHELTSLYTSVAASGVGLQDDVTVIALKLHLEAA